MPPDCQFVSRIQFCNTCILRISGVSRRSVQSRLPSYLQNRLLWRWILRNTTLDLFFRIPTAPRVFSLYRPLAGFFLTISMSIQAIFAMDAPFSRRVIMTRMPKIARRFSTSCPPLTRNFRSSRKSGLQTLRAFSVILCLPVSVLKRMLASRKRIPCVSPLHSTLSSRFPVAFVCRKLQASGESQMHLRGAITRNCHATRIQVQISKAWLVTGIRLTCRTNFSSLLLQKKYCNGPSLPLISIPSFLRIVNNPCLSPWRTPLTATETRLAVGRGRSSSPYHVATTYPCGQPSTSSLCDSLEVFATPTGRYTAGR